MLLAGIDFSCNPSRKKPITVATARLEGSRLALDGVAELTTLSSFETWLRSPGPWLGGFADLWRAQWRAALVVAVLGPLGYVLVLYAVQLAPLSHVAPAREVSMLFAALIGGRLLGEADRATRLLGAACIAGGVGALALG